MPSLHLNPRPLRPTPSLMLQLNLLLRLQMRPGKRKRTSRILNLTGLKPHLSQPGRNTSTKKVGPIEDSRLIFPAFPSSLLRNYTCLIHGMFTFNHLHSLVSCVSQNNGSRLTQKRRSGTTGSSSWAASLSAPVCTNPKACLASVMWSWTRSVMFDIICF